MSQSRTRNYTTIVYPESAPADWLSVLRSCQVSAVVSPLHDMDLHDDGSIKKPHYHVVLMFDSVKSLSQARAVCGSFSGVGCEAVLSSRHMLRYLCHLDEIDKHKYDIDKVVCIGDVDYLSLIQSASSDLDILKDIAFYIHREHIINFMQFVCVCANENVEWFRVISQKNTLFIKALIEGESCLK